MRDWTDIYARELDECPPVDEWAGAYFKHQPSGVGADSADDGEPEEWVSPFPDETE